MSITRTARQAITDSASTVESLAGHTGTLNGHRLRGPQSEHAIEGQDSPQATVDAPPIVPPPAGAQTAQPAMVDAAPMVGPLAGHENDRGHGLGVTHAGIAPVPDLPGAQKGYGAHRASGTGEQAPPASNIATASIVSSSLADPLLALAADVLSDLEKVRIANENRLRQLTRSEEDKDGETRGFGLDESHPDVARLAALVDMLGDAEHKATLNLGRLMRQHPMGPWLAAQKGIGEKQGARLLAAIGDPYIRPEIAREDGAVEISRPRLVSELWALCGYHVINTPVGQGRIDTQNGLADGPDFPAGHCTAGAQTVFASREQSGHSGHSCRDDQTNIAGVAPKRARGQKANWSSVAKMRAFLVAESCIKQSGTPYRAIYDATREKYADATHRAECIRCGPKGKPAQPGSPLSAGHQHARGLRAVAKEVLRDLWKEAKRLHEETPDEDECEVA